MITMCLMGGFCRWHTFKHFVLFFYLFNPYEIAAPQFWCPTFFTCLWFCPFVLFKILKTYKYSLEQVLQRQFTSFPFRQLPISFLYITSAHCVLPSYKMVVSVCECNVIGKMCLHHAFVLGEAYFYHRFTESTLHPTFAGYNL